MQRVQHDFNFYRFSISKLYNCPRKLRFVFVQNCNWDVETARIGSKRSNSLFFVKILWIHRLTDFNHISRNIPLYSSREFYIFTRQIKQRLNVAINHRAIIAGDLSDDRREIAKKRFAVKWNQKSGRSAFHILWLQHPQR